MIRLDRYCACNGVHTRRLTFRDLIVLVCEECKCVVKTLGGEGGK